MTHKTFYHKLISGENVKFTIVDKIINGETYYYAKVINTDLDFYKELSDFEKSTCLGVNITNGRQSTVYYRNPTRLENDLLEHYGINWLETEI